MTCRRLSASFRNRIVLMVSGLFRHRWNASPRRPRRSRFFDQLAAIAKDFQETAARVANSHQLTLVSPESLEQRAVMDVAAGVVGSTLGIWIDDANSASTAYIRQIGDGAGALLQVSTKADFSAIDVYNGAVPTSEVQVYAGAPVTVSPVPLSGGGGYTSSPTVTVTTPTFGSAIGGITATLRGTNAASEFDPINIGGGSGYQVGDTVSFSQPGVSTVPITATVTGVRGYNGRSNSIDSLTLVSNGAGFTSLTGLYASGGSGGGARWNFIGAVDALSGSRSGTGYYALPVVTFSGGGGTGAATSVTIAGTPTWNKTALVTDEQSSGMTTDLSVIRSTVGNTASPSTIRTVTLSSGSQNGVTVVDANEINLRGEINAPTRLLSLNLATAATGNISIGSNVNVASINILGGNDPQNFTATGGSLRAVSGGISIDRIFDVTLGTDAYANTTLYTNATNNIALQGSAATNATNSSSWVLLQTNNGALTLDGDISSENGTVTIAAPNINAGTILGPGLITGRALSIREGGASVNFALNANVASVSGNVSSNLTLTNRRDLTIGSGSFTLSGNATSLLMSTTSGNINVTGNITLTNSGVVSFEAANSVTITGSIIPAASKLVNVNITALTGNINVASALNIGSSQANLTAQGDVRASQLTAANLIVGTQTGSINVTALNGVTLQGATVGSPGAPGAGNLTITTLKGQINVDGELRSYGSGTTTLQANNGSITINNVTAVNATTGSLVLNAALGTISNTANGSLSTNNLTWVAQSSNDSFLNSSGVANYARFSANITGTGSGIDIKVDRPLTLGNITTVSGPVSVAVDVTELDRADLTVAGAVKAGNQALNTLQNVTFTAANGSITSSGNIAANILTLSAANSSTISNQSVNSLNATITGEGENLTVTSSRNLTAGDITLANGTLNVALTTGNLTRSGAINTGTAGTAILNVANGSILGIGKITSDLLDFASLTTPDLTDSNATFTRLSANVTQSGSINLTRSSNLTIDRATTLLGGINISLGSGGNLTINGPMTAGGNGNLTLNVPQGSITTTANAPGNITANVLTVRSNASLSLNTSANTLAANVTNGSLTINEASGLVIGTGNVVADNNVTLNVLNGNLARNGSINASNTSGTITLNAANGSITGNGGIDTLNLVLRSNGSMNVSNATNIVFSNVSANVTGGTGNISLNRAGDYTILNATTAGGSITAVSSTGNISVAGNVTAGGSSNVTLNAASGNVTVNASAVVTGGNLTMVAQNDSSLRTNVTNLAANISSGNLAVTALGGLNGSVAADSLNIVANGASILTTNVANLAANISNGGISIVEADDLFIEPSDVVAAGGISITSTAGNIASGGSNSLINAGSADVTLNAPSGNVTFNGVQSQIRGGMLTVNAQNDSAVNTAVSGLIANITAGNLTVNEADDLAIGTTSATRVNTAGNLTMNLATGNLTGDGLLNAAGDVTLTTTLGGITLNSSSGQVVSGGLLTIGANSTSNVRTNVSNVAANITGLAQGITVAQSGDLTIDGGNFVTNNGDISIASAGNLSRGGDINAGSANVALAAGGNITGAGLITANVLTVNAATSSTLTTTVNAVQGSLTTNLASLSIDESDDLDIGLLGLATTNGTVVINLAGDLSGSGSINAGGFGNVTLNTTGGSVTLNGTGQISGNTLTVNATGASNLGTNIATLAADITSGNLTVTETNGLNVAAGNINAANVTLVVGSVVNGNLAGTGFVNATNGVVITASNGSVNLTSIANQVNADNLSVTATLDSALNTNVANLTATITAGGLTIVEADDLEISPTDVTTTGAVGITVGGNLTGGSVAGINAGSAAVTLNAPAGNITLNASTGQVRGGILTLTAQNDSVVNTQVANLVANITAGNLTVDETGDLAIGNSALSRVNAAGDITINLATGNLTGLGQITANNGANNVSILLSGQGDVALTSQSNQIVANVLDITTLNGSIAANTAVNTVTAYAINNGGVALNQSQDLTINSILAVDGNVNVTLSAGNLSIDSGSILGGQLSNVTLIATQGSIQSTDVANPANYGVVFGDILDVRAQNTSSLNTSVTALKANISGAGESLTIDELDTSDTTLNITPNGLAISNDVVVNGGTLTINLANGDLTGTGNIAVGSSGVAVLNIADGSATLTARAGQVSGGELQLSVVNTSTINTNITTLNATTINGTNQTLTINEANDLAIGSGDLTSTNGSNLTVMLVGNLAGPGNINADGGLGDVVLNSTGGNVTLTDNSPQVVANVLTVRAKSDSSLNTQVTTLAANVTNGSLTITEFDSLGIDPANVVATGGIDILADSITGTGSINAGSNNVTLDVNDNVSLTGTNQIVGNVLTLNAVNTSNISTRIQSLNANVSGAGQNLTIREADGLTNSNVIATRLNVVAGGPVTISTNISSLAANVTGSLAITELNDLAIDPANVAATGVTISAGNATTPGNITGTGMVNGRTGNVSLTTVNGSVNLTASGQVAGNVLTLVALNNSNINTTVSTLNANVTGASQNLTVVETDSLTIGTNNGVVTNAGLISIRTLAGDLLRNGPINATDSGNVTLNINGGTTGSGLITADVLNVTVAKTSSINTAINTVTMTVTNPNATLSIYETNGLNVSGPQIGGNGTSVLDVANGNLNILGAINAPNASLTLNVPLGAINATSSIGLDQLTLRAANVTTLNTKLNTLAANVTGASNGLTVVEADSLTIAAAGVQTNGGIIDIRTGNTANGNLTLNGPLNAGANTVALNVNGGISGTGLVSGSSLNVTARNTSAINTNVNSVIGTINGASQTLTINEQNGLQIGAANLAATGTGGGITVNVATGAFNGTGNITTTGGPINVIVGNGPLNMTGTLTAGTNGNVALNVNGAVTMTAANQIVGNVLNVTASGTTAINTNVRSLAANITGVGSSLTVSDTDGLTVTGNGALTKNGAISLTAGLNSIGNLTLSAPVNAGTANVALNANGGINGAGLVSGNRLNVTAVNTSAVNTSVTSVVGTINGASQTLTINEQNGLQIGVANLAATGTGGGITVNVANGAFNGTGSISAPNGPISVLVGNGPLNMTGTLNAGTNGNVSLNVNGAVTMTAANQIVGNVLNIAARGSSSLNTAVTSVIANINGAGNTLTISDTNALSVGAGGLTTNSGAISLVAGRNSAGNLTLNGPVSAGTANVALNANGGINGTGLVSGNVLNATASNATTLSTSVNGLTANITAGDLTVSEANGLAIAQPGVTTNATSNVAITVSAGDLTGAGTISGNNVTLTAVTGGLNLTAVRNQVSAGNLLTVASNSSANLNTNVANLATSLTSGSLTIREANNLSIAGSGINTSAGNGSVSLTLTTGNLAGSGRINAGAGGVTLNASAGNITLNSAASQVAANLLTTTSRGDASINTSIAAINSAVTSSGNLTVYEANNLAINRAQTTNGSVNIFTNSNSTLEVYNITAATGVNGNVTLSAGNVVVYNPGITASGTLNIAGVGNMGVSNGGISANTVINQSNGNGVNWMVINSNSSGPGSLNAAIANANRFNGKSRIVVTQPTTINLTSPLPAIRKALTILGGGFLTLDGTSAGTAGSGLTLAGSNIAISGTTLRNFGGAAIDLLTGTLNANISNMTVLNSGIGIRARGLLTGSQVINSVFNGQNRTNATGALLSAARGLTLQTNAFENTTVGMTASGTLTGTFVYANSFSRSSRFGISLAAAKGLTIGSASNLDLRNTASETPIGVFASGFCTGSSVNKMLFGTNVPSKYSVAQSRNLTIVQ